MPESIDFANREAARKAIVDSAGAVAIGDFIEAVIEEPGITCYNFQSKLKGYPDWQWSVVMFTSAAEPATISEVLLLPTDSSLKAPDWVPWSERLADYQALQLELEAAAAAEAAALAGETEVTDESDDDKFVDFDEDDLSLSADVNEPEDTKSNANTTGRKLPGFNLLRLLRGKKKK